jgi:hypothetical protein
LFCSPAGARHEVPNGPEGAAFAGWESPEQADGGADNNAIAPIGAATRQA